MKKQFQIALMACAMLSTQNSFGFVSVSAADARTECNQTLHANNTVNCGVNAPVTVNVYGSGNVMFAPPQCQVSTMQNIQQLAHCSSMAVAGKAGDYRKFDAGTLPNQLGVDKFQLGIVSSLKMLDGIKAPKAGQGALVTFSTGQGLPISFLMMRKLFNRSELANLDVDTPEAAAYKAKLEKEFASAYGENAILTRYYRLLPGLEKPGAYQELWSRLDNPNNDPFAPNFNIRVYPNGLVVVETIDAAQDMKSKQIFPIGDYLLKPTDKAIPMKEQIPIGGGKFATPRDI